MHVGVCRITLHLPGNQSLKGKRRVVRSVCDRLRHRFHVGVAEVGGQDLWQRAVIGVVAVSSDAKVVRGVLERAAEYAEGIAGEALVADAQFDVFEYEQD